MRCTQAQNQGIKILIYQRNNEINDLMYARKQKMTLTDFIEGTVLRDSCQLWCSQWIDKSFYLILTLKGFILTLIHTTYCTLVTLRPLSVGHQCPTN